MVVYMSEEKHTLHFATSNALLVLFGRFMC